MNENKTNKSRGTEVIVGPAMEKSACRKAASNCREQHPRRERGSLNKKSSDRVKDSGDPNRGEGSQKVRVYVQNRTEGKDLPN